MWEKENVPNGLGDLLEADNCCLRKAEEVERKHHVFQGGNAVNGVKDKRDPNAGSQDSTLSKRKKMCDGRTLQRAKREGEHHFTEGQPW